MVNCNKVWISTFANDIDAYIPEVWAQESLMLLWQKMVMTRLVHRDFSSQVQSFGDVVNTRRPAKFKAKRKTNSQDVTVQNATATNVPVPLDQHLHTSFVIKDGEASKSFKDLVDEYLEPAVKSLAIACDQIVAYELYNFLPNMVGNLATPVAKTTIIAAREFMNALKAPDDGRNLVVGSTTEGALLNIADFTTADKIGDDGSTLRSGSMGRRFGFDIVMSQTMPSIPDPGSSAVDITYLINGAHAAGSTTLVVKTGSSTRTLGTILRIAGDDTPQLLVSSSGATNMVISPGLKSAVVDNAIVTMYKFGQVDQSLTTVEWGATGYPAGTNIDIITDTYPVAPVLGQMIVADAATTLAGANKYGLIDAPSSPSITLNTFNRSLAAALADNAKLFPGPHGEYNFAFHKNAISFVSRPLAMPREGLGARSAIADANGVGVRVTMSYNGTSQGTLVTIDILCGVKKLDSDLGVVVLGA